MSDETKFWKQVCQREFWKVEYVKRKALCECPDFSKRIDKAVSFLLNEGIIPKNNHLRMLDYLLFEYFCDFYNLDHMESDGTSRLSHEQTLHVAHLHDQSSRYGYMAHRISKIENSTRILELANEGIELEIQGNQEADGRPPYPKRYYRNPFTTVHDTTYIDLSTGFKNVGPSFIEQYMRSINCDTAFFINTKNRSFNFEENHGYITRRLTRTYIRHHVNTAADEFNDYDSKKLIALDRKQHQHQYRPTFYQARAVGLWLWDYIFEHDCPQTDAINAYRKIYGYEYLNHKFSGETGLNNALKSTIASVMVGDISVANAFDKNNLVIRKAKKQK